MSGGIAARLGGVVGTEKEVGWWGNTDELAAKQDPAAARGELFLNIHRSL